MRASWVKAAAGPIGADGLGEGRAHPGDQLDQGRIALKHRVLGQFFLGKGVEAVVLIHHGLDLVHDPVQVLTDGDGGGPNRPEGEGDPLDGVGDLIGAAGDDEAVEGEPGVLGFLKFLGVRQAQLLQERLIGPSESDGGLLPGRHAFENQPQVLPVHVDDGGPDVLGLLVDGLGHLVEARPCLEGDGLDIAVPHLQFEGAASLEGPVFGERTTRHHVILGQSLDVERIGRRHSRRPDRRGGHLLVAGAGLHGGVEVGVQQVLQLGLQVGEPGVHIPPCRLLLLDPAHLLLHQADGPPLDVHELPDQFLSVNPADDPAEVDGHGPTSPPRRWRQRPEAETRRSIWSPRKA